jgi:hypothetical protein
MLASRQGSRETAPRRPRRSQALFHTGEPSWDTVRGHRRSRREATIDRRRMSQRPPAIFYVVGFVALALSIAGFVLSIQNEDAGIAAAATGIGAAGFLSCAWMLKRS